MLVHECCISDLKFKILFQFHIIFDLVVVHSMRLWITAHDKLKSKRNEHNTISIIVFSVHRSSFIGNNIWFAWGDSLKSNIIEIQQTLWPHAMMDEYSYDYQTLRDYETSIYLLHSQYSKIQSFDWKNVQCFRNRYPGSSFWYLILDIPKFSSCVMWNKEMAKPATKSIKWIVLTRNSPMKKEKRMVWNRCLCAWQTFWFLLIEPCKMIHKLRRIRKTNFFCLFFFFVFQSATGI